MDLNFAQLDLFVSSSAAVLAVQPTPTSEDVVRQMSHTLRRAFLRAEEQIRVDRQRDHLDRFVGQQYCFQPGSQKESQMSFADSAEPAFAPARPNLEGAGGRTLHNLSMKVRLNCFCNRYNHFNFISVTKYKM